MVMLPLPEDEEGIDAFLLELKEKTLPKELFTHSAHVLTAACYVARHGEDETITLMRERVRAFNVAVGGKNTDSIGYHETITVFWVKVLAELRAQHSASTRAEFARLAVERFGGRRDLLQEYYTFDVVASREARRAWVAPDLRPLN
jgi:hypothetical protein